MDQFLENHKLLTLNQDEINNLNSIITTKEIDFMILKLQKNKFQVSLEISTKQLKN